MTTNDQPMDHVPPESTAEGETNPNDLEKNVTSRSTWLRLLFMLIASLLYGLSRLVVGAVVIVQFAYVLLTGEAKEELKLFGRSLAIYSYQVVDFLTFNTEVKPFPLDAEWPSAQDDQAI